MTQFNHDGYVVRLPDGTLLHDSHVSAYSHRRAVTNSVLEPVPAVPGLYVRATARELAEMPDSERAYVHEGAIAWAARFDLPAPQMDDLVPSGVADETPETNNTALNATEESPDNAPEPPGTVDGTVDNVTLEDSEQVNDNNNVEDFVVETGEQIDIDDAPVPDWIPPTIDDVTLEELVEMARELDIPGRSKMDKGALFEAVRQAAGVQS